MTTYTNHININFDDQHARITFMDMRQKFSMGMPVGQDAFDVVELVMTRRFAENLRDILNQLMPADAPGQSEMN